LHRDAIWSVTHDECIDQWRRLPPTEWPNDPNLHAAPHGWQINPFKHEKGASIAEILGSNDSRQLATRVQLDLNRQRQPGKNTSVRHNPLQCDVNAG